MKPERRAGHALLALLLILLIFHAAGVCLDFGMAIRYPFELDYGEGIVWYQAELIPGPRMYARSQELPFIVFHYPPVYHLLARAARVFEPDFMAAGRLVSALATLLIAPLVMGLVLVASRQPGRRLSRFDAVIAAVAGLLVLCLHAVRAWGLLMRVDMVAIALCMAGLLVATLANGRFLGTALALLLCVAAVFTKQTQLPAGVAVFLFALWRNPKAALGAAVVAGGTGLAAVGLMQHLTDGGFLQNIVASNINRIGLRHAFWVFWPERFGAGLMLLMVVAAPVLLASLLPAVRRMEWSGAVREFWALRQTDRATGCWALMLLHFALASLLLPTSFKSGGSFNYLLEWLSSGGVLLGILLIHLARTEAWRGWAYPAVLAVMVLTTAIQPFQAVPYLTDAALLARQKALVDRIARAGKPVASDDMVLLMRAGKTVYFEPSIVTELASVGRWDEAKLVEMIRSGGFAFIIVNDETVGATPHRTAAMDTAMREAYPRVEYAGPRLWLNLPRE